MQFTDAGPPDDNIPTLEDAVGPSADAAPGEAEPPQDLRLAELQTELAVETHALADKLLHEAVQKMEGLLLRQLSGEMRQRLPELIEEILDRHFGRDRG